MLRYGPPRTSISIFSIPIPLVPVPCSLLQHIHAQVAICRRRHVSKGQRRAFPKQAGHALAGGVQSLQMEAMFARAQPQRAAIVAHGVARRAADLRKRRAGLATSTPSITSRAPSRASRWKVYPPSAGISINPSHAAAYGEPCGISMQIRRLAGEHSVLRGQIRQFRPCPGIDLPLQPRQRGAIRRHGLVPLGHGHHSLRGPILAGPLICHVQQNAEAARADGCRPVPCLRRRQSDGSRCGPWPRFRRQRAMYSARPAMPWP